jgi:ABC-type transport system involved in multi-copper enzyme maturation permease subunit
VRLREVFRYEFSYRLRSPSTWTYAAFLLLITTLGALGAADQGDVVKATAGREVAQRLVLFGGTFGLLVSAALFGDAAIRDAREEMDQLLYTTRLSKLEYLGGRFLAALAINAIVVLVIPLAHGMVMAVPLGDADGIGPVRVAAYLQPFVLFILPNLVIVGAVLFTIGVLARQVIPVYLGAIGIFISYIVAANYWNNIGNQTVSVLADPLGINALLGLTRYWTPVEQNTRLIGFPTMMLWNRLLWLAIATGLLALLHRKFRFAHADGGGRREKRRVTLDAPSQQPWSGSVPQISGVFAFRTRVSQTLAVARQSLVEVASGRAFQVAIVGSIGLVLLWGWNAADTVFDTSIWPVTHLVVSAVLSQRSILIPWLIIALYAGELVWKDREVGSSEIADAIPVPTGIALVGRFLALVAIVLLLHTAFMVGGILLQTLQGYHTYELGLYVRVLFGLNLLDDVLLAALAMAVHVIVNQKYVGYIIVLAACVASLLAAQLGFSYLAVYNSSPGWTYSDMNGFGPFLRPRAWFKLYWAAWALLLGVVTVLFWMRGREPGLRSRFALVRARFHGRTAQMAGVAAALILLVGGFVFYNTSILNASPPRDEVGRPRAEYERRYGRFAAAPQPMIAAADLRIEMYPHESAVDMRGSYRLVNRTSAPIDSIHVVTDLDIDVRSISLDRASRPVVVDKESGYGILQLDQALQPGDSLRLLFDVAYRPRGFRSKGIQTSVVANGSYFDRRWLPFIGYQPFLELSDGESRKRFGLGPQPPMPGPEDAEARHYDEPVRNENQVPVEVVVGTSIDQIAVIPGVLRKSWTENGRRYFHYGSDVASTFSTSVFSARYALREDRWRDVPLQIFYHPTHRYNLDRMVAAMKASLDYYTSAFGPYQFRDLRIVEAPPYGVKGRAFPGAALFAEDFFITRAKPDEFDQTFFGTAHEIAHQWWGGQLRHAYVKGGAFLSETLANYSAMLVTEKTFGPEAARRVYAYQMDRYLQRRAAFSRDVPLTEVDNHPHIAYGKGAVAMYTLRDYLGEETLDSALRRFLEKHRDGPPYATSLDLMAELHAATPDSLQYLLTDFFETVTLWDVKTERAVVEQTNTGEFHVSVDVVAKKLRAGSAGHETEIPMDDFVDIGAFEAGNGSSAAPLYLKRHRIRSGKQTISFIVPRKPSRAGVDPLHKLIDRKRDDNVVSLAASP